MAISRQRSNDLFHSIVCVPLLYSCRWNHTVADSDSPARIRSNLDESDTSIRKTLDSRIAGIQRSAISLPTWSVMRILQEKGFDTYLVGGCVRDLLLKRTPKDFDIITTATLKQVSSFSTSDKSAKERRKLPLFLKPQIPDKKDTLLWKNSMERDFTINGLFYDPFGNTIYDYVDGITDLRTRKVRTVVPAHTSFKEDCARILRGLRIAARLGWEFSTKTEAAIQDLCTSIVALDKSRLMMELNFMLGYGAAESSMCLLQKFKILELLLPAQAAYLVDQTKVHSRLRSNMLMLTTVGIWTSKLIECKLGSYVSTSTHTLSLPAKLLEVQQSAYNRLLFNLDKLLSADRPSDCSLWLALLAFHQTLVDNPQDAIVVWVFSSILYYGSWSRALESTKDPRTYEQFNPEISSEARNKSDESLLEEASFLASLVKSSIHSFTSVDALGQTLNRYPGASSHLDLGCKILVSENMAKNVSRLFHELEADIKSYNDERIMFDINYEHLKRGDREETKFVLGKIIMDTLNGKAISDYKQDVSSAKTKPRSLSELFK